MSWRPSQQSWKQRFQQQYQFQLPQGDLLTLDQAPFTSKTSKDPGDTGCTLWDSSLVLAQLVLNKPEWIKDKRVVELGSGIGLLGILISLLGARQTTLSDLDSTMTLLQGNIAKNKHLLGNRDIQVIPIHWGDEMVLQQPRLQNTEVVVCSDLVYRMEAVQPLVTTLCKLCHLETKILFAQDNHRPEVTKTWERTMQPYFHYHTVPKEWLHPEIQSEDIIIRIYQKMDW
ncbi:hypothetical protein GpartN1_g7515.t1 [Galdieria partita]|uniref:Uncharacterized protein n=1 Tax=Galdieria partita TaxID=83374 RepID=A0A9C7Q4U4_9RHOD|nr:hypothetical protein GpartN1_g7515.t1 [Galdieria partita]